MKKTLVAVACFAALMAVGQDKKAGKGAAGDAVKGKDVFESNCIVCHNADSKEKKMGPGLKGLYKEAKLVNGKAPTDANILAIINAGGNGMPAYEDMLTAPEKKDLLAYLKTL
jgi:cytochrome c